MSRNWIVGLVALSVVSLLVGLQFTPNARDKRVWRAEIAVCWERQAFKSLTPEKAREAAERCERFGDYYFDKFGEKP